MEMRRRFLRIVCSVVLLLPALGSSKAESPPKPLRIVSTSLVTDEILVALVDSSRIAALSMFSVDAETSNVSGTARKVGSYIARSAEPILRLQPDLVLDARYSKIELQSLVREAGIPYLQLKQFGTLADIEANIRAVGTAVGEDSRAGEVIGDMRRKLGEARQLIAPARRSWKALYLASGEWTAGAMTTADEIFRSVGLRNAAADAGIAGHNQISLENVLRMNPDIIVVGSGYQRDAPYYTTIMKDPRLATLQAVRNKRVLTVPSRYLLTTSHFIAEAALYLGRSIAGLGD